MANLRSAQILDNHGIDYRLIELGERALSIEDVITPPQPQTTLAHSTPTPIPPDRDGGRHAAVPRGGDRVDSGKAGKVIGKKVSIAGFAEVKEAVGVDPGAVCPLTLELDLFVDRKVMELERINFGSGDHMYGLEIRSQDLEKVVGFRVVDVAKAGS